MEGRVKFYKSGDGYGFIQERMAKNIISTFVPLKIWMFVSKEKTLLTSMSRSPRKIRDERLPPSILKFINLEESPLTE